MLKVFSCRCVFASLSHVLFWSFGQAEIEKIYQNWVICSRNLSSGMVVFAAWPVSMVTLKLLNIHVPIAYGMASFWYYKSTVELCANFRYEKVASSSDALYIKVCLLATRGVTFYALCIFTFYALCIFYLYSQVSTPCFCSKKEVCRYISWWGMLGGLEAEMGTNFDMAWWSVLIPVRWTSFLQVCICST